VTAADYERALGRLPNWMILLGTIGTALAARYAGISGAVGFLTGALAAWLNLRLIERGVDRIVRLVGAQPGKARGGSGVWMFVQFFIFGTLAFVILRFTGFNLMAALFGFLVCPAAAIVEIVYELITYGHS
jgi:ATP synthase I chain